MSNTVNVTDEEAKFIRSVGEDFWQTLGHMSCRFFPNGVPNTKLGRALVGLHLDIMPAVGPVCIWGRLQQIAPWALQEKDMLRITAAAFKNFLSMPPMQWSACIETRVDNYWRKRLRPAALRGEVTLHPAPSSTDQQHKKRSGNSADLPGLPAGATAH